MDKILVALDKKYNESPWLFRIFFFMLGYILTGLVVKLNKK